MYTRTVSLMLTFFVSVKAANKNFSHMIYMTYILKHFLKAIYILMSSFTDYVFKKGNGKYVCRTRSFTDEDTKLIVQCNACRGRKKDTMPLSARSICMPGEVTRIPA